MNNTAVKPRDHMLRDRVFCSRLFHLSLPIALNELMLALVAAADALMLGSLDQNAMSAVSLATQVQFIQNCCLYASVCAFSILAAQYWGKGDRDTVSDLFFIGFRFLTAISFLFFAGCLLIPETLMSFYTNEPVLIGIGADYLRMASWSYLLCGMSRCYLGLMKVTDHTRMSAVISSAAVVLNIILNAVLIYGLLGAPAMGVEGAALATVISRGVEMLWSVLVCARKDYTRPQWRHFLRRSRLLVLDYYKCLAPTLGSNMLWSVGFTAYTACVGHLGTDAAAANSVTAVIRDLVCCLCNGLGSASGILVGNELGAGNIERGKLYGRRIVKLSFICGFISTGIMLLVTPLLMHLVRLTDGAQRLLTGMMVIMAFYMIGRAVNTIVINGLFYAGGDAIFDFYSLIVAMWCIAVPLAALGTFVFNWPVLVVYACTCVDEVGKIPWVMARFRKYRWAKDLTR